MKREMYQVADGVLTLFLNGRIDSSNAPQIEEEIGRIRGENEHASVVVDCGGLSYISSAGLRVILRLRKDYEGLKLVNVSPEVYEILDMTGFTEMMEVNKAYRTVSVEGCEVIGRGANGEVYRIDRDTIVKVYLNPDSLPDIKRERELARKAFVLGIPTAIPYDVVRVGDGYGSVFELLNAKSFAKLLIEDPANFDLVTELSVSLLKKIHAIELEPGEMPDMKAVVLDWVDFLKPYLPEEEAKKLRALVEAVPEDRHMMHGDYHLKNVMLQNGEALLIDMDTLCMGYPVFEFGSIFNAYIGYGSVDPSRISHFLGIPIETAVEVWDRIVRLYFAGRTEEQIEAVKKKAQLVGYTRILRRAIRRSGFDSPEGRAEIELCKSKLTALLAEVDSLLLD